MADTMSARVEDLWILWFEDQDVPPILFSGEGAEIAAHRTYKKKLTNWSCRLLKTIDLRDELTDDPNGVPLRNIVQRFLTLPHSRRREIGLSLGLIDNEDLRATTANDTKRNEIILTRAKELGALADVERLITQFEAS